MLVEHLRHLHMTHLDWRRHYLICRRHEGIGPNVIDRVETLTPWEPLGHSALNRTIVRLATRAGIADPAAITPHAFRRWALETFIAQTGDLHAAAELAGHRDVNQTRRYAGRSRLGRTRNGVAAIEATIANTRPAATPLMGAPGIEPGASRKSVTRGVAEGHDSGA